MYQPDALINNDSGISLDLKTENEKEKKPKGYASYTCIFSNSI